ncbi:MAG: hypothetical protein H6713_09380 [Myxococcales bacterium]|nr:hypothetical protein [Myxococcales bacterium]MCB9750199.1 hypothetical protein [Myxococcales bacterium]
MFSFGSEAAAAAPQFVPEETSRDWIATALRDVIAALGSLAQTPRRVVEPAPHEEPKDLDSLFDFICATQEHIGQDELEFTLLEMEPGKPPVPPGFEPVGDPAGHLLHTFARGRDELIMLVLPQVFKAAPLVRGGVARELGRMGLMQRARADDFDKTLLDDIDQEAAAELAGIALGMGVWIANGTYMFENACCGGGCGIDLRSVSVNLSLPEACFALALDGRRKGFTRRSIARLLEPTQRAAFKKNWSWAPKALPALTAATARASVR